MSDAHHDDWFKHTPDEVAAQEAHGAINAPFIIAFLVAVIAITFTLIFVILGYVSREVAAEHVDKFELKTSVIARESIEARTRWRADLEGDPRWTDMEARTVRMPMEYAAREIVTMYSENQGSNPR